MEKKIRVYDGTFFPIELCNRIREVDVLKKIGKLEVKFFRREDEDVVLQRYDTIKVLSDGTPDEISENAIYVIGSRAGKYETISLSEKGSPVKSEFSTLAEAEAQIPKGYSVRCKLASGYIDTPLPDEQVFVFGSNPDGNHNGGAAAVALLLFGAKMGVAEGLAGHSYALPSVVGNLEEFKKHIDIFISFVKDHPEKEFVLTRVGCGSAFWTDNHIAPLFSDAFDLPNVFFPPEWDSIIRKDINNKAFNRYIYALGDICGSVEDWVGNLTVLYARLINVELSLQENGISVIGGSDNLLDELLKVLNSQFISGRKLRLLQELYRIAYSIDDENYKDCYHQFLSLFNKICKERNPSLIPEEELIEFLNILLWEAGCDRIYNPFAGLGAFVDVSQFHYKLQEPDRGMHLASRLLISDHSNVDFYEGNFEDDWLGDDCDGLLCILPGDYKMDRRGRLESAIKDRAHRLVSYLLHKLDSSDNFKRAVVVVKEDVLFDKKFANLRKLFLEKGAICRVIPAAEYFYEDAFILCLDFARKNEYVRFAEPGYWSSLKEQHDSYFDPEGYPDYDYWLLGSYACEVNPIIEMCVPVDTIVNHNCILDYFLYNEPLLDADCYNTDLFQNFEKDECIPLEQLVTDLPQYCHYRKEQWEIEVSENANRDKVLPDYLWLELRSAFEDMVKRAIEYDVVDLQRYIATWPIRIPEGGIEAQAKEVERLSSNGTPFKRYRIIADKVETRRLAALGLQLLDWKIDDVAKNRYEDKYKNSIDAIVVSDESQSLDNALELHKDFPVYVLTSDRGSAYNRIQRYMSPIDYEAYKESHIFADSEMDDFRKKILKDLENHCSPSTTVRSKNYQAFECAKAIDAKYDFGYEEFIESILIDVMKTPFKTRPKEILEQIRSYLEKFMKKLSDKNITPRGLKDTGAVVTFIADHHYSDNKTTKDEYYQIKPIVTDELGFGLKYLIKTCNQAHHETCSYDADVTLSIIHIFLQLVKWIPSFMESIDTASGQGGLYWISKKIYPDCFDNTSEGVIKKTNKSGNSYYYCGNVHLNTNKQGQDPEEGRLIKINDTTEEKEPFFTGDNHTLFYSKDWEFVIC